MKIEIKNRWNGSVLFSCEMASIHLAVTMAIESGADLTDADLTRANLDYSCWPLWCGSKSVKVNLKLSMQLAAHFCALQCDAPEFKEARKSIIKFALKSHRAKDLGITSVE